MIQISLRTDGKGPAREQLSEQIAANEADIFHELFNLMYTQLKKTQRSMI